MTTLDRSTLRSFARVGLLLSLASCERGCGHDEEPPAPSAAAPSASVGSTAPSPRLTDARWKEAVADGDPLARMTFADRMGARELAAALSDEEPIRGVALDALRYAEDAPAAYGAIASRLGQADGDERARVLAVLLEIVAKPPPAGEILDPEGGRACAEAVVAVARDASVSPEERALAVSVAHRMADGGWVDRRSIPGAAP